MPGFIFISFIRMGIREPVCQQKGSREFVPKHCHLFSPHPVFSARYCMLQDCLFWVLFPAE